MKISVITILPLSLMANITILNNGGITYDIKEKNAIEVIQNHIKANKEKIDKKIKKITKDTKKQLASYKPKTLTKDIPHSTKDNIFYIDPTYTLEFDIKDNNDKILYPKGYRFNPLHYVSLQNGYIFFDYTDKKQVNWIKKNKFDKDFTNKLIITNGKIFEAIKDFNRDVYYATDKLIDKFGIKATPSISFQEGDKIKVYQYYLKEEDKK